MNVIATISGSFNWEKVRKIIRHPVINAFRWNTGASCPESPSEALHSIQNLALHYSKQLYVDLKCRQLRVNCWCAPAYCEVELNHEIEVELPAKIQFRGTGWLDIRAVQGNKVYLMDPPREAFGKGQSANILAKNLIVKGYFTEDDIAYIKAAKELGIKHFMLSFYEGPEDIEMFRKEFGFDDFVLGLKIESEKGIATLADFNPSPDLGFGLQLVVARDDLMVSLHKEPADILEVTRKCLQLDPNSIVASQFFRGIEQAGCVNASDISDVCLMYLLGYKNMMLSDEICLRHFDEVMELLGRYPEGG